jgi:excisionase family DNA binding protein
VSLPEPEWEYLSRTVPPITLDDLRNRTTLSVDETASVLGIGRATAYEMVRRGDLPVLKGMGRRFRISAPALLAIIEGRQP